MATAIDAKADLVVGTGADAFSRLGVGANNTVLTADSAEATGLKWATASAGALTKITSGTFSNVATVDIDSVFSSTYKNYMAVLRTTAATETDDLQLQYRIAGPSTITTATYYGSLYQYSRFNALVTGGYSPANQATLAVNAGTASGNSRTMVTMYFSNVGVSSDNNAFWGTGNDISGAQAAFNIAGMQFGVQTVTGFRLKSSSTNISGDYAVYGLAD
jgi:hypothetical protein